MDILCNIITRKSSWDTLYTLVANCFRSTVFRMYMGTYRYTHYTLRYTYIAVCIYIIRFNDKNTDRSNIIRTRIVSTTTAMQ